MADGPEIGELADGRIHVNHGPIDLLITIDATPSQRKPAMAALTEVCHGLLEGLVAELAALRSDRADRWLVEGPTASLMVDAAMVVADLAFVTPMAAVAGSVADTVCEALAPHADRVIVNNGGDIAFALPDDGFLDLALADVVTGQVSESVRIHAADPIRGVATSGRHGRSLTTGIADSVTVFARSAALADAAATVIAGAVDLPDSPAVTRKPANQVDAATDLADRLIVTNVGPLTADQESQALLGGLELAEALRVRSAIVATFLKLGRSAATADAPATAASGLRGTGLAERSGPTAGVGVVR